jgi:chromosome segregation ATPase
MLSQFYVPEEDGQEESPASLLEQLQVLNTALREERAKRISLEDEIDSFQVGHEYSDCLPELLVQLETMKKQAEECAMQREEMEKKLEEQRKMRELEENRLAKAQNKLKAIKQKLGQVLAGLNPDVTSE